MVKVLRDLRRSPGPTPLLKQGHLEQVAEVHVQTAFEYLQRGRIHSISGQHVLVLSHPHMRKRFPMLRGTLLCFSWCPLLWSCHHWWAWLHLLCTLPLGICTLWERILLMLLLQVSLHQILVEAFVISQLTGWYN